MPFVLLLNAAHIFQLYTPQNFRTAISHWIVDDLQSFSVVDNTKLREVFQILKPDVTLFGWETACKDVQMEFAKKQEKLIQYFSVRLLILWSINTLISSVCLFVTDIELQSQHCSRCLDFKKWNSFFRHNSQVD